jgi:P-type E1-E2 ATPase
MMAALFVFSLAFREIPMGELLLSLISLAVASVPEGLPAIISILSLGVQAMARKRAIIRKLPTVETLGAMTVVCSDKTGTLTMNEMTVKAIITADACYRVDGNSYEPVGNIYLEGSDEPVHIQPGTVLEQYLRTIDLCNDSQLIQDERGLWGITGGPTEGALKVLAAKANLEPVMTTLVNKIPFDSQYKYMSTHTRLAVRSRS